MRSIRCAEMVTFLTFNFPPPEDAAEIEFVDVNPSLENILGLKLSDPAFNAKREVWKDVCPTLAGSQIVVRFPLQKYARRLEAKEYVGLIGWSTACWRHDTPFTAQEAMPSCSLMANLAGNFIICRYCLCMCECIYLYTNTFCRQRFFWLRGRAVDFGGVRDLGHQLVGD